MQLVFTWLRMVMLRMMYWNFIEKSSIGKILEAYAEALESEEVLQNVNESTGLYEITEDGTFDTRTEE